MHLTTLLLAASASLASFVSASAEPTNNHCHDPDNSCWKLTHLKLARCSRPWWDLWYKCKATGCWNSWDPVSHWNCDRCKDPRSACEVFSNTHVDKCSWGWYEQFYKCRDSSCKKPWGNSNPNPGRKCCDHPKSPCKQLAFKRDCSPEWFRTLEQCKKTGCIQWFIDPAKHCNDPCKKPDNACNRMDKYETCSPNWYFWFTKCKEIGCRVWIQDPENVCRKCDNKWHPCNQYPKAPHCSPKWKDLVKKCKPTGCIHWIQDPLNECHN